MESSLLIAAFSAAVRAVSADSARLERTAAIKEYALSKLKEALPRLEIISQGDAPHICAITLPGYKSEVVVRVLGDQGVCISSGSACHKGKPSHVYAALNLPKTLRDGVLRVSFSYDTKKEDVDALADALAAAKQALFPSMS